MTDDSGLVARAGAFLDIDRPTDALPLLQAHLASHPDDVAAMVGLARALNDLDRYDEAADVAENALRSDPTNLTALMVLAAASARLGRGAVARAAAEQAQGIAPNSWTTHLIRASVDVILQKRSREGKTAAAEALLLAPDLPEVHITAAATGLLHGEPWKYVRHSRLALALQPSSSEAQMINATAQFMTPFGQTEGTRRMMDSVAANPTRQGNRALLFTALYLNFGVLHLLFWVLLLVLRGSHGIDPSPYEPNASAESVAGAHALLTTVSLVALGATALAISVYVLRLRFRGIRLLRTQLGENVSLWVWLLGLGLCFGAIVSLPLLPLPVVPFVTSAAFLLLFSGIAALVALRRTVKTELG